MARKAGTGKRKGNAKRKGNVFEREICRCLSLWWTDNESDDVFWRTPGSGARATVRSQKGRLTPNHYGDVCSVDDRGLLLTNQFVIELKRGYASKPATIADLLDCYSSSTPYWSKWITKAQNQSRLLPSASQSWMIIAKRDQREAIVCLPTSVVTRLVAVCDMMRGLAESDCLLKGSWIMKYRGSGTNRPCCFYLLEDFLDGLRPQVVRAMGGEELAI